MTPEQIKGLWNLLGQTWGDKFMQQYGAEPNQAWTLTLAQVPLPAARLALDLLIRGGSGFPPTLPEFIAAAKKYRKPEDRATVLALPKQDPARVKANLERIRAMLRE